MITIHRQICTFLLIAALCLLSIGTYANFDPTNPPEPYVTYDVTVGVTPSEAGKATGAGKYLVGDKATIKTTANKNYKFQYWTINGYAYPETATSFTYIVGDSAVVFLAHFKYEEPTPEPWVPTNPPEPYMTQHVSVDLDPLEGGYTRGTGDYVSGTQVKIEAHPYVNYALKYWTINDYDYPETNESFTYLVGDSCVHIVGHLVEKHLLTLKTHPRAAGVSTMSVDGQTITDMLIAPEKVVQFTTTANTDYVFRHWTVNGYPHSTAQSYQYTMGDTTASVVAVYDYIGTGDTTMYNPTNPPEPELREDVTVIVLSADESLGTVSGGGTYPFATIDTLIATPTSGYVFRYWHDGNQDATRIIRAERDTVYIAYFGNDTVIWNDTICYGTTLQVGDSVLDKSGHYEFYTTRTDGLLTWNIVNLTIWHEMSSQFDAILCTGEPFHYEGVDYTEPGTYTRVLQNRWGCDSVVTFTLTEFPSYDTLITASICESERYQLYGFDENATGMHIQYLKTDAGCDSIIRLDLTVYPEYDTTIVARICDGERYTLNGFDVATTGIYHLNLQTQFGCDSLVHLALTVDTVPTIIYYDTICSGQSITWNGQTMTSSGEYIYQEPTDTIACGYVLHKMNLYVRPQLDILFADTAFYYCSNDDEQILSYTILGGEPTTYSLELRSTHSDFFMQWSEQELEQEMVIPTLPQNVWPDRYVLIITMQDAHCDELIYKLPLYVNYSSDFIITQRWNDLLAVRQTAYDYYNGFSSYQWYCDGLPISGANQSTYYKPEGLAGSTYQVEVTRTKDGVKALSCPYTPTIQPSTSTLVIQPTAVSPKQNVQVITPDRGEISIISYMGDYINQQKVERGQNIVTAPERSGIYLVYLVTPTKEKYIQKLIVY